MGIPLSVAKELRCQQPGEGPDSGDHDDVLTSSYATTKAQAQAPSTIPSFDPLNDSRPVHLDPVHHGQHSFPLLRFSGFTNSIDVVVD